LSRIKEHTADNDVVKKQGLFLPEEMQVRESETLVIASITVKGITLIDVFECCRQRNDGSFK
jgi:hypothetical protein